MASSVFEPTPVLSDFNESISYVSSSSSSSSGGGGGGGNVNEISAPRTPVVRTIDLDEDYEEANPVQTTTYCHGCERKHSSTHMHTVFGPSLPLLMARFPHRAAQFARFSPRRVILCCKWFKPNHPQCIRRTHFAHLLVRRDPFFLDEPAYPMLPPPVPPSTSARDSRRRANALVSGFLHITLVTCTRC
jgi:hypothetical protein